MSTETPTSEHGFFRRCTHLVETWMERHRHRQHLGTLQDNLLHDVGMTAAEREEERTKPFWRD